MKAKSKSNCFFGAIAIKKRFGGKLKWSPGWKQNGFKSFIGSPWGHWQVIMHNGDSLSYNAIDKDTPVCKQLWFHGYIKRQRSYSNFTN